MRTVFSCIIFITISIQYPCKEVYAQGKFEISGTIEQKYNNATISLSGDFQSLYDIIETKVVQGKFNLTGIIDENYKLAHLSIKKNGVTNRVNFFITNTKMTLNIIRLTPNDTANSISYDNIPFIELQREYADFIKGTEDSIRFLYNIKSLNSRKGLASDSIELLYKAKKKYLLDKKVEFIKRNSGSYFALYCFVSSVLKTPYLTIDSVYSIYSKFTNDLKLTPKGESAYFYIKKKQSLLLSSKLPDLSFKTNFGENYRLSQFRGKKFVLICFWASWCKPCIKNIPSFIEIYKTYPTEQLQIISISIDTKKENWLPALQKYKMPWLQTCDIQEYIPERKVQVNYAISLIPQYFLIDKNGDLIYQNIQLHDDNLSKLKKILHSRLQL